MTEENDPTIVNEPMALYNKKWTYSDYLKFDFDYMVELIHGHIYKMTPAPNSWHQEILGDLHVEFRKCFSDHPCKVYLSPFDVILPVASEKRNTSTTVVQPDLCVICDLSKIEKAGCFGPPDLVVEILSPHTSKKDIDKKHEIYEEVGVKEYWIVFPMERLIQVFFLKNNSYKKVRTYTYEDSISSELFPELEIALEPILQEWGT